jgi:CHASE2 domain-containing sensor protein
MGKSIEQKQVLHVSANYRWMENGHILLWLIKDTCWALEFKPGGILMIFPTVFVAFYITWRSRSMRSELYHNIAVCCWILANSIWMLGEFFEHDSRPYAASLFATGLAVLGYYYLRFFRKDRKAEKDLNRQ